MNIQERLRSIIRTQTPERGRFRVLAERSDLSEANWKSFFYERQRPNPEMFEWACKEWPQFTLWLMTGVVFVEVGQIRPALNEYRKVPMDKPWTAKYMKAKSALLDYCMKNGIDAERIKEGDVPMQVLEAISSSRKMCEKEIQASFEDQSLNWEELDNDYPCDEQDSSGIGELPNFIPHSESK